MNDKETRWLSIGDAGRQVVNRLVVRLPASVLRALKKEKSSEVVKVKE